MNAWLGNKLHRKLWEFLRTNMLLRIGIPGIGVVELNLCESSRTLI